MAKRKPISIPAKTRQQVYEVIDKCLKDGEREMLIVTLLMEKFKFSSVRCKAIINARKRSISLSVSRLINDADVNRGVQQLRYQNLYADAVGRGDYKTALTAAKELGILQGLTEPLVKPPARSSTKITNNTNVLNITSAEGVDEYSELSDAQLALALGKGQVTEKQAQKLTDQRVGKYDDEEDA